MRTSHKITQLVGLFLALVAFAAISYAQPAVAQNVQVSDQKAGALLVYPFYTSDGTTNNDTRITISNVGPAGLPANPAILVAGQAGTAQAVQNNVYVHLFLLQGSNCSQADVYLCLSKFASISFLASNYDPGVTGWIIAVAVDWMGYPVSYNGLIGNAFVNAAAAAPNGNLRYVGNYGAEAFNSRGRLQLDGSGNIINAQPGAGFNWYTDGQVGAQAALNLNNAPLTGGNTAAGIGYDAGANSFAVEFQSTLDSIGQTIVSVGLATGNIGGNLGGNGVENNKIGAIYNGNEKVYSFTGWGDNCQTVQVLTDTNPRVVGGLKNAVGRGQIGTMVFTTNGPSLGLFITPNGGNNFWSGIRGLHKRDAARASALSMPVFMPAC